MLVVSFLVAFTLMRDTGFAPTHGKEPLKEMKELVRRSIDSGLGNPPVRWVMLTA